MLYLYLAFHQTQNNIMYMTLLAPILMWEELTMENTGILKFTYQAMWSLYINNGECCVLYDYEYVHPHSHCSVDKYIICDI